MPSSVNYGTGVQSFLNSSSKFPKEEQTTRLAALQANPATSWRVDDAVLQRLDRYKEYNDAVTRMYRESDTDAPIPWIKLQAKDSYQATANAQRVMIEVLGKRVKLAKKDF